MAGGGVDLCVWRDKVWARSMEAMVADTTGEWNTTMRSTMGVDGSGYRHREQLRRQLSNLGCVRLGY